MKLLKTIGLTIMLSLAALTVVGIAYLIVPLIMAIGIVALIYFFVTIYLDDD